MAAQPINELYEQLKSEAVKCADELFALPKDYAISAKADFWNGVVAGFKAGAEWQKEQMMKEAMEGQIYGSDGDNWIESEIYENLKGKEGDKVRIIIVKED